MSYTNGNGNGHYPKPKNVLGGELKSCCTDPMTGFYRDGYCRTGADDTGSQHGHDAGAAAGSGRQGGTEAGGGDTGSGHRDGARIARLQGGCAWPGTPRHGVRDGA